MQAVRRLLVISDIHGQIDAFNRLLEKSNYNPSEDLLFLLGDYIDRGQDPRAVVEKVRELEKQGAVVLKGNHEDMMEKALAGRDADFFTTWMANGGNKTLTSFGAKPDHIFRELQSSSLQLSDELTDTLSWVTQLNLYAQTEHYLFVHAGVDPEHPVEKTDEEILLWIREPFFTGYHGEKTVIFGHTPTMFLHNSSDVYFGDNNIIGIDGGCVFGGKLNCLELPSNKTYSA